MTPLLWWNKRAHRITRADFVRPKGNEGLTLLGTMWLHSPPLVPLVLHEQEQLRWQSVLQDQRCHFPKLKPNDTSQIKIQRDVAGWSGRLRAPGMAVGLGLGFPQQAGLLEGRSRAGREEQGWLQVRAGWLQAPFPNRECFWKSSVEPCSSCHLCLHSEPHCIHCRCPMSARDTLPALPAEASSLITKKWIIKVWEKKEIKRRFVIQRRRKGVKIGYFSLLLPVPPFMSHCTKQKQCWEQNQDKALVWAHQHLPALPAAELWDDDKCSHNKAYVLPYSFVCTSKNQSNPSATVSHPESMYSWLSTAILKT